VPVVVVERGERGLVVVAASAEARAEGVMAGQRRREAEARCAGVEVVDGDELAGIGARLFESVARAIEVVTPGVVLEEPGRLGFATRGPSRYFGGDEALAARVLALLADLDVADARVGIADGVFAARLAAYRAGPGSAEIVPAGTTTAFLSSWPVEVLGPVVAGGPELAHLLVRLGLGTLGAFAQVAAPAVLGRFGPDGARAHRLARGLDDEGGVAPLPIPPELVETCELDPPAARVDEAAFAAKSLADHLLARLDELGLTCSQVVVEAETEHGERLVRRWRHEGALSAAALVARVRWQLEGWLTGSVDDESTTGGLSLLRLVPDQVGAATGRQLGFWADAAAQDRADHAFARIQGLLGHDAVTRAVPVGGRFPTEQVRWVPWGEPRTVPGQASEPGAGPGPEPGAGPGPKPGTGPRPWPGAVPGPSPARVHVPALPACLLDGDGHPVGVGSRGEPSGVPARLECAALPGGGGPVVAWAGPWAYDVRWWDRNARRRRALWQVVVGTATDTAEDDAARSSEDAGVPGIACLVVLEHGRTGIEAIYD
jgi:protein ImuB